MRSRALVVVLLGLSCAHETSDDPRDLYHTWTAESGSLLGVEAPPGDLGMRMTFSPEKILWEFETPDGPQSFDGLYRLDATKSPKEIDLVEPAVMEGVTYGLGIYEIEGDMLTICMDAVRPTSFSDDAMTRLVLRRGD